MFSAVDAVLLRPLPFAEPERLVMVGATSPMTRGGSSTRRGGDLSPADYLDYRSSTSFEGLAAVSMNPVRLTGDGTPEQAPAAQVSGNFFSVLGVNAIAGRTFLPADDAPGQPAQAVVSEPLWERRYGRAADLVGRTITVSDQPVEVVGIAPAGFQFEEKVDIWLLGDRGVPRFTSIPTLAQNRDVHILTVVGRLRQDVSLPEAQAELDVISARLAREYPATNKGWGTALDPLQSALVGHTQGMLVLLLAAVALMLVIASVNVANLMLVRTKAREVELAMRSALGASPGRVIRQILAESMVLAACGGALGLALAAWGVSALVQLAPEGLPRLEEIAVNSRIAGVCRRRDRSCRVWLWSVAGVARITRASDDRPSGKRAKHVRPWKPALAVASCVERARHRPGAARSRRVAVGQLRAPCLAESGIRSARSRRR